MSVVAARRARPDGEGARLTVCVLAAPPSWLGVHLRMRQMRSVAAPLLAVVLVASGCAALRQRWTERVLRVHPSPVPRADVPAEAVPLGHFLRGQGALARNDVDTAVAGFGQAGATDPHPPLLRLRLGTLYV